MQITTDIVTIILSVLGSAVVVGISWGTNQSGHEALRDKVRELSIEIDEMKKKKDIEHAKFVTFDVFNSVIGPMQASLTSIQTDIKDLIRLVTKNQSREHRRD